MGHETLIQILAEQLKAPLPGHSAQLEMTSRPPDYRLAIPEQHRKSATLTLLYSWKSDLWISFMQRTEDGNVHSGQISFPGGKMEPEDPDSTYTALREAEEELGIKPRMVQILGELTPLYIPPSNFLVYPKVGYCAERPSFKLEKNEVARLIEVSLTDLMSPNIRQTVNVRARNGMTMQVPAFIPQGNIIWGATAMMLNELLTVIRDVID